MGADGVSPSLAFSIKWEAFVRKQNEIEKEERKVRAPFKRSTLKRPYEKGRKGPLASYLNAVQLSMKSNFKPFKLNVQSLDMKFDGSTLPGRLCQRDLQGKHKALAALA